MVLPNRFIADVHLGKLARLLRLLGFDTAYKNDHAAKELIQISREESRVLLSRTRSLVQNRDIHFFIVKQENPLDQLKEVVDHFNLNGRFHPFSRCIVCNGLLLPVAKETILHFLQKNTGRYFHEFWQCENCKRIYWKGSHYERMLKTIEHVVPEEP